MADLKLGLAANGRAFGIPRDAVSETFAILAIRGAGKTTTAVVMAEEMCKAGRSSIVPYRYGEPQEARHGRRQTEADARADTFRRQIENRGGSLAIKNEGMHWIIKGRNGFRAEWWPLTAKCVVNQQWSRGIHVHDTVQLAHYVLGRLS